MGYFRRPVSIFPNIHCKEGPVQNKVHAESREVLLLQDSNRQPPKVGFLAEGEQQGDPRPPGG